MGLIVSPDRDPQTRVAVEPPRRVTDGQPFALAVLRGKVDNQSLIDAASNLGERVANVIEVFPIPSEFGRDPFEPCRVGELRQII